MQREAVTGRAGNALGVESFDNCSAGRAELPGIEKGVEPEEGEVAHAVRWARRNACSSLDAAEIIGRLAREGPETLQVMWDMCEIMAEIDGEVKEAERQAVIGLRGLLEHGMRLAKESKD